MKDTSRWAAVISATLLFGSFVVRADGIDPNTADPKLILSAMRDGQKASKSLSRARMAIEDKSGKRERVFSTRARRYNDAVKTLLVIEQPTDMRNMGFLTIDYAAKNKGDEQWVYLPKLNRVSRLPESGKSDPFVGSDFSISDMSSNGTELSDFDLRLVEASAKVGDEDCWVIESKPRTEQVRDLTGYVRTQLWISKSKLILLQFKGWANDGKRTKFLKALDIRKEQGVWTPHRMQMRTLVGNDLQSETVLELLSIDNDSKDVVDSDFTVQRLEHGA
jgi:hypothetical protein